MQGFIPQTYQTAELCGILYAYLVELVAKRRFCNFSPSSAEADGNKTAHGLMLCDAMEQSALMQSRFSMVVVNGVDGLCLNEAGRCFGADGGMGAQTETGFAITFGS